MPAALRTTVVLLFLLLVSSLPTLAEQYIASDSSLVLESSLEFEKTFNPHAILSLQTADDIVVLVTKKEEKFTLTQLYDGIPSTFEDGVTCMGRVLLSVDKEDAATFLIEGMFPPEQDPTHNTVFAVANHSGSEYTFMIHYPKEMKDDGLEWSVELLSEFRWQSPAETSEDEN